jgi:Protein of unknown function (DUF2723)
VTQPERLSGAAESRIARRPSLLSEKWSRAQATVFLCLCAVYLITLAPDVTLWDAGEFNAAIATLGIPHPPGTPLYILVARVWSRLFGFLPQVVAVNALSAVATAAGCAILAGLIARWTRSVTAAVAAGVASGTVFAVWQNATETEVYALSMCLAICLVAVGDLAGRTGDRRHRLLLAYLMALAVPVQISALVAAPAAIVLAATPARGPVRWPVLWSLGMALGLVIGAGVMSTRLMVLCIAGWVAQPAVLAIPALRARLAPDGAGASSRSALALLAAVGVGLSAALFMLVRAAHDPGINQGNPSTWQAFLDVIARRQYAVPPLWPRRAPLWLQIGNLMQYSDWQVALGLDDSVAASWRRTPWSVVFGLLSIVGARWHWQRDARSARSLLILLLGASLGVTLVLNLRAGPSIGVGVLPADAGHEPRERDYFFALAFAVAVAWSGLGAVSLAARLGARRAWIGIALASLPIALNWSAANRRRLPDASLARALGTTLLESAPPRAVLLLAGDNDSYTTWFTQRVTRTRDDVTPVTIPLLGAQWYRAELARRDSLLTPVEVMNWSGEGATLRAIAGAARARGRALVASVAVDLPSRRGMSDVWTLRGIAYVADSGRRGRGIGYDSVDVESTRSTAQRIAELVPDLARGARDPVGRYISTLLSCPARALAAPLAGDRLSPVPGC